MQATPIQENKVTREFFTEFIPPYRDAMKKKEHLLLLFCRIRLHKRLCAIHRWKMGSVTTNLTEIHCLTTRDQLTFSGKQKHQTARIGFHNLTRCRVDFAELQINRFAMQDES